MFHMNPVYKRELKQNARMKKSALMLFFYNFLLAVFGLFALFLFFGTNKGLGEGMSYHSILQIYAIILSIDFVLVLCFIPAITAGAIAGEREKKTLELLLTTNISPLRIILGKLAASISMILLLAISTLPIISLVFVIGGIGAMDLAKFLLLILVTAVFLGSIGVFFSTYSKKTTTATVCSYLTLIFLTGGLVLLLMGLHYTDVLPQTTTELAKSTTISFRQYGNWVLLLLVNPIFSFLSILTEQTGIGGNIADFWNADTKFMYFIARHWFLLSLSLQLLLSAVILYFAKKRLERKG